LPTTSVVPLTMIWGVDPLGAVRLGIAALAIGMLRRRTCPASRGSSSNRRAGEGDHVIPVRQSAKIGVGAPADEHPGW
jgi:hypothetical protein